MKISITAYDKGDKMSDPHIVKSLQWRLDRALGKVDVLEWQLAEAQAELADLKRRFKK